jgi:type II secretory pathway pseudopilin PulG
MRNQRGFALLIELLIVCIVSTTLMAMAVPAFLAFKRSQNQQLAEQQIRTVAQAQAAIAICQGTAGCSPSVGLTSLVPVDGILNMFGYTLQMQHVGATWIYTAQPIVANSTGYYAFYVDTSGQVRCEPVAATLTSPICAF